MAQQTHEPSSTKEQIRQTRIQKLADLADKGVNPYPYKFEKLQMQLNYKKNTKTLKQALKRKINTLLPVV